MVTANNVTFRVNIKIDITVKLFIRRTRYLKMCDSGHCYGRTPAIDVVIQAIANRWQY